MVNRCEGDQIRSAPENASQLEADLEVSKSHDVRHVWNSKHVNNFLEMSRARVIYWFRTDLRLHDSPALQAALSLNPEVLWPIWCFDPYFVYHGVRVGPNRWQFLYYPKA